MSALRICAIPTEVSGVIAGTYNMYGLASSTLSRHVPMTPCQALLKLEISAAGVQSHSASQAWAGARAK